MRFLEAIRAIVGHRALRWLRAATLNVILPVSMLTSGCATLGYVPERPTLGDTTTFTPTITEVKKWAYAVADGYDSRATMNRQALHAGALLAAAGTGAIAGLAAFNAGGSALTGISIGATFLAGVAAVYSSEEKSRIYRLGSEYIKDLITKSDERLRKYEVAVHQPVDAEKEAENDLDVANEQLKDARVFEKLQIEEARSAREKAEKEADEKKKKILTESAQALEELAKKKEDGVEKAKVAQQAADSRLKNIPRLVKAWKELLEAKATLAPAKGAAPPDQAAIDKAKEGEKPWAALTKDAEALCLRDDVNDVMRRVEEQKALLDPKNIPAQLRAVEKAAEKAKTAPRDKGRAETTEPTPPTVDLKDLAPPVKSRCDGAI